MIFDRVAALVAEQFMVDTESIEAETHFIDDLGATSRTAIRILFRSNVSIMFSFTTNNEITY